jgi:hypothetical protein
MRRDDIWNAGGTGFEAAGNVMPKGFLFKGIFKRELLKIQFLTAKRRERTRNTKPERVG